MFTKNRSLRQFRRSASIACAVCAISILTTQLLLLDDAKGEEIRSAPSLVHVGRLEGPNHVEVSGRAQSARRKSLSVSFTRRPAAGFDVNDVSLLFPLKNKAPYPAISVDAEELIPRSIFEAVLRFEDANASMSSLPYLDGKFVGNRKRWFVTSIRIDDCGEVFEFSPATDGSPVATRGQGCQSRLRLVIQPFNLFGNPIATAIHLLFKLDSASQAGLVRDLSVVKRISRDTLGLSTDGQPLMLHPGLVAEAASENSNAVALAVRDAVLNALGPAPTDLSRPSLELVTMSLQVAIDHWKFVGGHVENGVWNRFVTEFSKQYNDGSDPSLAPGVEDLACDRNAVCLFRPALQVTTPRPSGLVLSEIFQDLPDMKALQVPGYRNDAIHIASEIIDTPSKTHFFNTNCVSCHASSNLRDPEKLHTSLDSQPGVTPFVPKRHLSGLMNNVINFGYWGSSPRISTRTASESARVADSLNRGLGVANPGTPVGDLTAFWKCLVSESDFTTCL
jgi:hypothetical protein